MGTFDHFDLSLIFLLSTSLMNGSLILCTGDYTRKQDSRLANAPKVSPEESARGMLEGVRLGDKGGAWREALGETGG